MYPEFKIPVKTFFLKYFCPCGAQQSLQSCMDMRVSSMQQYMRVINRFIGKHKSIRGQLTIVDHNWTSLLGGSVEDFLKQAQCSPHSHKDLTIGVGSTKKTTYFIRWECTEGICDLCRNKLMMNECSVLNTCSEKIKILEWIEAPRNGEKLGDKILNLS